MAINRSVQYNEHFTVDPSPYFCTGMVRWHYYRILLLLYPFNYELHCFVVAFVSWSCMAINVSVQHNGGFLPGVILTVDPMLLPSSNPSKSHQEVLSLQSMNNNNCKHLVRNTNTY